MFEPADRHGVQQRAESGGAHQKRRRIDASLEQTIVVSPSDRGRRDRKDRVPPSVGGRGAHSREDAECDREDQIRFSHCSTSSTTACLLGRGAVAVPVDRRIDVAEAVAARRPSRRPARATTGAEAGDVRAGDALAARAVGAATEVGRTSPGSVRAGAACGNGDRRTDCRDSLPPGCA